MSNPYQSPESLSFGNPPVEQQRDFLRQVARYQQWVIFALAANVIVNILSMVTRNQDLEIRLVITVVAVSVVIFSMVSMFLLASRVYGIGTAILCTILMLVPCVSLITLLVVNQKATGILQAAGIKVGIVGANPNSI